MKRDMDLIRWILLEIEKQNSFSDPIDNTRDDYSQEVISYHVLLLHEAGLIEATDLSTLAGPSWIPERLTWEGHEFLEASKDNSRWNKVKDVMSQSGGFVFEIAKSLLVQLAQEQAKRLVS